MPTERGHAPSAAPPVGSLCPCTEESLRTSSTFSDRGQRAKLPFQIDRPPPPPFGNTALTVKVKLSEVLDADGHWPVRTGMGMGTGGLAS